MDNRTVIRRTLLSLDVVYTEYDHGTFEANVQGKDFYINPGYYDIRVDYEAEDEEQSYGLWVTDANFPSVMEKAAALTKLLYTM